MVDAGPGHVAPTSQCEKSTRILFFFFFLSKSYKFEKQKVKLNVKK